MLWSPVDLIVPTRFFTAHLTRLQLSQSSVARIVLQQPSLSSGDTLQQLHWIPFKWRIQFTFAFLTFKVLHTGISSYICLKAFIPTFLFTLCNHPVPPTCTSFALLSISIHARVILQLQGSGIVSFPPFVRFKH